MIIPLGIAAFLVFYFVFYFAITKFDLKTPGREDDDEEAEKKVVLANNNYTEVASAVLAAVGGKENVKDVGYCATRLRFEVLDNAKVDEKAVKLPVLPVSSVPARTLARSSSAPRCSSCTTS